MRFTILVPSRKRVNYLKALLKTIYDTAKFKNEIEVIVMYDFDDGETHALKNPTLQKYPEMKIRFKGRQQSPNINGDYYNWGATFATGKYIIASNDDCEFMTLHWDAKAWDRLEKYLEDKPDGIVYGHTAQDDRDFNTPDRPIYDYFSYFPLISKVAVDVLGGLFDKEFWRDGGDITIYHVYKTINRMLDLRDCITIKHVSFRANRRPWDECDEIGKRIYYEYKNPPIKKNLPKFLELMNAHMAKFAK